MFFIHSLLYYTLWCLCTFDSLLSFHFLFLNSSHRLTLFVLFSNCLFFPYLSHTHKRNYILGFLTFFSLLLSLWIFGIGKGRMGIEFIFSSFSFCFEFNWTEKLFGITNGRNGYYFPSSFFQFTLCGPKVLYQRFFPIVASFLVFSVLELALSQCW
ncbi:hypothetical protein K435DRAFT_66394 [Dendrothele bispora CBS 962.96]|uniref:Uncharacterized protein n=1 Tax=Dendrothele bispora (strain CBS 962.96) TaxID=1314807 RepID=A0A4S8M6L9_DENBC|nr:hypothetical protein K435DRAFT_66394 [Dendrothele bispora CBS 962.96]